MIRKITSYEGCRDFVCDIQKDPRYADPMLKTPEQLRRNLLLPITRPENHCCFAVYRNGKMTGLFSFLALRQERYLEMLVGLCREREGYQEAMDYLRQTCPNWGADFVFSPKNDLLRAQLREAGAFFDPEQQKMVFSGTAPDMDTEGVVSWDERFAGQYAAIHSRDLYWTAEKVMQAPDRFRTFLAVRDGQVVGYLDVTYCYTPNEPYDLLVLEPYRRMGYGKKLLKRALEENGDRGMMLLVETDNLPAVRLYAAMGFRKAEGDNSQTAHWQIPECP